MANESTTALMSLAPSFVVTPDEIKTRIEELQRFVKSYMIEGEDYGTIPGTQKPTLYKPGAEKLCDVYGFTKEIEIVEKVENWEKGMFAYTIKAILRSKRTGFVEAEGVGQCNSMEAKYRWSWLWPNQVPAHTDTAQLVTKSTKKGPMYRVPNEDPYSLVNTVLKMAKKRALVDAVLSATRSSGLFTQDLEDMRANGLIRDDSDGEPQSKAPGKTNPNVVPPNKNGNTNTKPKPVDPLKESMSWAVQHGFAMEWIGTLGKHVGQGKKSSDWNPEVRQKMLTILDAFRVLVEEQIQTPEEIVTLVQSYEALPSGWTTETTDALVSQLTAMVPSEPPVDASPLDEPLPDPLNF